MTLEQVYGAITYYLSHRDQVEQYLRRQDGEWAKWRARSERQPSAVVDRLRGMKAAGAGKAS